MASFIISFNRVLHPIILKYLDEYRQVKIEKLAPGRYASIFLLLLSDTSPKSTAKALFQAIIHKLHNAIDQLKRSILAVQIPRVPVLQVQIFNRNAKNSQPAWKQLPHNSPTHKPQYKKKNPYIINWKKNMLHTTPQTLPTSKDADIHQVASESLFSVCRLTRHQHACLQELGRSWTPRNPKS